MFEVLKLSYPAAKKIALLLSVIPDPIGNPFTMEHLKATDADQEQCAHY